ncbi:importin subunit alpha-9-like [Orbicella faveolata]|uniref:importin subunit alpha-9-like n=1 Tax=Orbicella faveolata TaxID=48498 RepID=UPI0009E415F2|nr:importin subunit alpha-9-like [Orbicella faveolata]
MDRKDKYKTSGHNVTAQRSKRRDQEAVIRKEKRDKLLSSKRIRFSEIENDCEIEDYTVEQVQELARTIQKSDKNILNSLKSLRKAFTQGSELISAFLAVDNSLRALVGHLTGNNAQLQLEAAWCITNLATGVHDDTMKVLKASAAYLITYLSGQNVQLQDQCAWALGNFSGDSQECREILRAQGIIVPMVKLLKSPISTVVQSAAFALSNLARGEQIVAEELLQAGIAPILINLLTPGNSSIDVAVEVAWVLSYLTSKPSCVPVFVSGGIVDILVHFLASLAQETPHNPQAVTPMLRSLGNVVSGPDEYGTQAMQSGALVAAMMSYLQSMHRHIKKESLWVLSNLTAGPTEHTDALIQAGILPSIMDLMSSTYDIKKEAAICLCNISHHGPDYLKSVLDSGAMEAFINIIKSPDQESVITGLQFFEMALRNFPTSKELFEVAEGVACLEALEYNCNETICRYANELLDTYFMEEGLDEDDNDDDKDNAGNDVSSWRYQDSEMTA